ncbi:MAG: sulfide/dihydroorotate dehydrogenase-like FAD/NAD-binding protein [Oscillospiraceae bacterium]|nr:sulfide/dihydroorotate dehydrogenase-like FAD/NAD-binding protein [Oscillospiraceae bacterium]
MYKILEKKQLNENVFLMEIAAPHVARKVLPGQFIIFRVNENGERVPLTVSDYNREKGSITIICQAVGKSTRLLASLEKGDSILDIAGPLGMPTELEGHKKVAVIGGGVGCAIAYPQAKMLSFIGAKVDMIAGFRNRDIVILEEEMRAVSDNLYITTDDGSYGEKGFVTTKLLSLIESGENYDLVIAIGPVPMMRAVAEATRPFGIKTIVSLNPIMIDGTGMCGGCRVTVGGEIKFACVDGPDFDGHKVDFSELMSRNATYRNIEKEKDEHFCKIRGDKNA